MLLSRAREGSRVVKKVRKVRAAIFLPSKSDLVEIFALALCLPAVHYTSGETKEVEKKKASWSIYIYIHIYVGTKQFFLVSAAWLLQVPSTLLSGRLLNHAAEMLGYIAFTCTIFGTAVKWRWFVTMFHVNSNKSSCNRYCSVLSSLACWHASHLFWTGVSRKVRINRQGDGGLARVSLATFLLSKSSEKIRSGLELTPLLLSRVDSSHWF